MEKTAVIRYNLRERGRQFRGQPRNFNIPLIVKVINSPACQERVAKRDMLGFYGHWPRIRFGMMPTEGGIENGKPAFVEPAIVTTMLKAYDDGTIEHQEEFLDTPSGVLACKLYHSKVGGFSSVIGNRNSEFFGFDYVNEPNYSTNRGYTLDSVGMSEAEVEAQIYNEQIQGIMALIDSVEADVRLANQTVENLQSENAEYRSLLAKAGIDADSVKMDAVAPIRVSTAERDQMLCDMASFRTARSLPSFEQPKAPEVKLGSVAERLLRGY